MIVHSRWTGRFAGATAQAAIKVDLRPPGDRLAFEHLFDQIDASARSVQLVAQQLIGGTGGVAEPAVNAAAQNAVGFPALRRVLDKIGKICLHGQSAIRIRNTCDRD